MKASYTKKEPVDHKWLPFCHLIYRVESLEYMTTVNKNSLKLQINIRFCKVLLMPAQTANNLEMYDGGLHRFPVPISCIV